MMFLSQPRLSSKAGCINEGKYAYSTERHVLQNYIVNDALKVVTYSIKWPINRNNLGSLSVIFEQTWVRFGHLLELPDSSVVDRRTCWDMARLDFGYFERALDCGPMVAIENPALKAFVAQVGDEVTLAQVLIRRSGGGYELRHVQDRDHAAESLRTVRPTEARLLAQFTSAGEFRPLKAAPTLQAGWRMLAATDTELELALGDLYPGALADWHAAQTSSPPVTNYRACTERQSGMYRITAKLTDVQAAEVITWGCGATQCLKRRLWTVTGLQPDPPGNKSLIPCLEPCAVLLELARKAARAGQKETCAEKETD
jgi:4Fe-4S iron-sulfur cluster binding domain/DR2241 stabilising domain